MKPRENERFHGLSDFVYIRGPRNQNRPGFLSFRCATISLGFPRDFVFHYGSAHLLGYRSFRVVSFDFENFKSSFFASFQKRTLALFLSCLCLDFTIARVLCIDYLFHFEFRYFEIIFVTNIGFSSFISEIGGSNSKKVRERCSLRVYPFEGFANVLVNEV